LGLDSKMFDCQTLVLLAFARLESDDRKGLQRCCDDFKRLLERHSNDARYRRFAKTVTCLALIQDRQFSQAVDTVRDMVKTVQSAEFDFEAASNLLALLALLAHRAIQLDEVANVVDIIGMRFCTSRSHNELLAGGCRVHPPYSDRIRASQTQILKLTESAMAMSMAGNQQAAVETLLMHGKSTGNAKLIDTAHLVLQRYPDKIADAQSLAASVVDLRVRFSAFNTKPALGEQKRNAGGLTLRTTAKPASKS
jgi:hypothetical protein